MAIPRIKMNDHHSPEPWKEGDTIRPWFITDAAGGRVLSGASPEDTRRIIACVNFLRDIPTEMIEGNSRSGCIPHRIRGLLDAHYGQHSIQNEYEPKVV